MVGRESRVVARRDSHWRLKAASTCPHAGTRLTEAGTRSLLTGRLGHRNKLPPLVRVVFGEPAVLLKLRVFTRCALRLGLRLGCLITGSELVIFVEKAPRGAKRMCPGDALPALPILPTVSNDSCYTVTRGISNLAEKDSVRLVRRREEGGGSRRHRLFLTSQQLFVFLLQIEGQASKHLRLTPAVHGHVVPAEVQTTGA
jgi:hypothetical protein